MEFTFDYANLAKILEDQELDSPGGQTSPQVYGQLLAIYLLFNDLTSAKFLWKRIPDRIKAQNAELALIWSVGKLMWKKNYAEIYRTIDSIPTWPNHLKNIMKLISESSRQRLVNLITRAYSSISLASASQLLGLSESDTLKLAEQLRWNYDSTTGFIAVTSQQHQQQQQSITQCDNNQTTASAAQNPMLGARNGVNGAGGQPTTTVMGLDNGTELLQKLTEYIVFLESAK